MTAATLDLPTRPDGQLDSQQPLQQPLQQLADTVAALWSAGTGVTLQPAAVALDTTHATVVLAESWPPGGRQESPEALLSRLDRPFGRRSRDLACVLQASVRELLGHPLTRVRARDRREQGRVVVELSLAPALEVGVIPHSLPQGRPLDHARVLHHRGEVLPRRNATRFAGLTC